MSFDGMPDYLPSGPHRLLKTLATNDQASAGVPFEQTPAGVWQMDGTDYRVRDSSVRVLSKWGLVEVRDDPHALHVKLTRKGRDFLTPPTAHLTATGVGATLDDETGAATMDIATDKGTVRVDLTEDLAEALGLLLLDDPDHSDGTPDAERLARRVPIDHIERFLKRQRDRHEKTDVSWHALNDTLDAFRLHVATGTPLTEPTPHEGAEPYGVGDEPLTEAEELRAEVESLRDELDRRIEADAEALADQTLRGTGHVPDGSTEFEKKL